MGYAFPVTHPGSSRKRPCLTPTIRGSSSLYAACAFFGSLCASEAEHEQHSDRHPFLRSRSPSTPDISCLFDSIEEVLTTVVGRVLPHPSQHPAASNSSILALECPLPCRLNVPRDPAKLRGRQREGGSFATSNTVQILGDNVSHHTTTFTREGLLHQYRCTRRRKNVECSSALGPHKVEYRLHVRLAVRVRILCGRCGAP